MLGSDPKVLNFVKNSPFYQKFRERRYRNPAKYCPWEAAALNLSESCIAAYISGVEELDECGRHAAFNAWHLFKTGGPAYWCDSALMEALKHTTPPPFVGLPKLFDTGVFLLPNDWLKAPDGWPVRWAAVSQLHSQEAWAPLVIETRQQPETLHLKAKRETEQQLIITTHVGDITYSRIVEIQDDGGVDIGDGRDFEDSLKTDDSEKTVLDTLSWTVFQLMLVLASRPDFVAEQLPKKSTNRKKLRDNEAPLLNPVWIGRGFKVQAGAITNAANLPTDWQPKEGQPHRAVSSSGSHSSHQMHWRRGHWRRVPIGEGRRDRAWRWIQPTLVKAEG